MKKRISIILFVFLAVSLAGCSNAAAEDTVEEKTITSNPPPATESAPAPTTIPTDTPPDAST